MDNITGMIVVVFGIVVVALFVTLFFKQEEPDEQKVETPKNKSGGFLGYLIYPVFILIIIILLWVELKFNQPDARDCMYTDRGCQNEGRFGWP